MSDSLTKHPWWDYIHEDLRELLKQSILIIDIFSDGHYNGDNFHDFSFVVFPAAKAYEGFLKTLFKDLNFITEADFYSKRFRIGKALNPALEHDIRESESVYDKLTDYSKGRDLSNTLWETWKNGRNILFHWFPNETNAISYEKAKKTVNDILDAMDFAYEECKINDSEQ